MESISWNVGAVKITQLVEVDAGSVIQQIIPNATRENIAAISWLKPHFVDDDGNLKALVQAFLVETGSMRLMIDTCIGNAKKRQEIPQWSDLQTDFLGRLTRQGVDPDEIDIVLCTHLHFDHVGWNTKSVDGKWVPTFSKARYLFGQEEFNYWNGHPEAEIEDDHAGFNDSVLPILHAGLADLIPFDHSISPEVSLSVTRGGFQAHCRRT